MHASRVRASGRFAAPARERLLEAITHPGRPATRLEEATHAVTAELCRTAVGGSVRHSLRVDGAPFIVFGAQVHNSSGWPDRLPAMWSQLKGLHANTAEVPVYWDQVEPSPGRFDFSTVDAIVEGARVAGLRLVLLWFATWKNGVCDYAPEWVKRNASTYPLMTDRAGRPVRVLSPHAAATRDADARAFAALMAHLKAIDERVGTVLMVQVENEPGSLFVDRDYSATAESHFAQGIPGAVVDALGLSARDWNGAFPGAGGEAFNAWSIGRYVETVARAGREAYDLPLVVNVWLKERKGFMRPGLEYPSGVPVSHLLDLWKLAAPTIDVIAPDIYVRDYVGYRDVCAAYARADNPLFIPETGSSPAFAGYLFYALADYGAIGWSPFGIDRADQDATIRGDLVAVRDTFRLLAPAMGEIQRLQLRGTLRAAVEQQFLANQLLHFEGFDALVEFGSLYPGYGGLVAAGTRDQDGRVLVGEIEPGTFFVAGFDARVSFRSPGRTPDDVQFLRVEEGEYRDDRWIPQRRINGDQAFFGLRLPSEGAIYRVTVAPLGTTP